MVVISHDITTLISPNQKKVITALSASSAQKIQSTEFISSIHISASSAQQALEVLLSGDLVYKRDDEFYCVLDPAMKYYLSVIF